MYRNKQAARKIALAQPRAQPAVAKRSNYNKWHKNQALSDITVIYGRIGERKYAGHRLVFCNASQWFANALKDSFLEANQKELMLNFDDPNALEAFFEFAYKDDYTVPTHGDTPIEVAKNQFMLHLQTYVVADKYMAENLAEFALQNVENIVKTQVDKNSLEFYRFAVKIVYEGENIFENDEEDIEEEYTNGSEQGEGDMVGNEEVVGDREEERKCDVEDTGVTANYEEQSGYEEGNLESFPDQRVKAILVAEALHIWLRAEESFNRYHVAKVVREVPEFGTDLAIAALESPET